VSRTCRFRPVPKADIVPVYLSGYAVKM